MDTPTVKHNVPLPNVDKGSWVHLFAQMKVGSFFEFEKRKRQSVFACATSYSKHYQGGKWKFQTRLLKNDEGQSINRCGIWRVE
jgi:L-asparaginase II